MSSLLALVLAAAAAVPSFPYTKYQLPNGLTVILHEDHTTPTVVVDVLMRVGSRDEKKGRTGFAHLFEHLMFMGAKFAPGSTFDTLMEALGGQNNASTGNDWTEYYEWGPSNLLPVFLWLEGDRLGHVGQEMTQEKLDLQRKVVQNERRQTSENTPYGVAELEVPGQMFPVGHPYHHPVIGSHEDLTAANVQDVKDFFAKYYVASNATLLIAGDFKTDDAKAMVEQFLGWLPKRPAPERPAAQQPVFDKAKSADLTDAVQLPRIYFIWHSAAQYAPGDADLDIFASVLAQSKASRLQKALVHEARVASKVVVAQESLMASGMFTVEVTAAAGKSAAELEQATRAALDKALGSPPSAAEIAQARTQIETRLWNAVEALRTRASILARYNGTLGEPSALAQDLERYAKVTPESVLAEARKTIDWSRVFVLRVNPKAKESK